MTALDEKDSARLPDNVNDQRQDPSVPHETTFNDPK